MITYDGLDGAIVNAIPLQDDTFIVVYDRWKIIDILMERDGMSYIDAQDYVCFNIDDAYLGEYTPIIYEEDDQDER
jgi:hypothetical protein